MRCAALVAVLVLAGCAHTPPDEPDDPLEGMNRAVFKFNQTADRYVLRPVAQAYEWTLPEFARTGIGNFFSNLLLPTTIVNDLLQFKLKDAGIDLGRFIMNSTIGLAGFIDVSTTEGIPPHDEDFGQTLGYWGVGQGWYLMLPLYGPASNRDLVGGVGDYLIDPRRYIEDVGTRWSLTGVNVIDRRAQLLRFDSVLDQQLDRYVFVRTIYLQSRLNKVYDGNPPKEDFGFDE